MDLKVVACVEFPDGTIKDVDDLTQEEKERLAMQIDSAPGKVFGFKNNWQRVNSEVNKSA